MQVNKRIITTASILGATTLLLAGAVIVPTVIGIRTAKSKIADANRQIETRYFLRVQTRESVSQLEEVKKKLANLPAMAIREGQELDFVNSLESAASSSDVDQNLKLDITNQKQLSPWEADIPISIDATGNYADVITYLRRIEKLSFYIRTNSIELTAVQQRDNSGGKISIRISGVIRWLAKDLPMFRKLTILPDAPANGL